MQIFGLERMAEGDVALGDENVDGGHLRRGRGNLSRPVVGPAREICGHAASAYSDGQNHNACGIHTLHFPHDAATFPPP